MSERQVNHRHHDKERDHMMTPLKYRDAQREEGFTLIELLVVVIIIGILAAIAIPVFLNQRQRAWNSAAQSDLRNAAVGQETYYTDYGTYTDDEALLADQQIGFNPSRDVTLTVVSGDDQGYCMTARHSGHTNDQVWSMDNVTGAPIQDGGALCTAP
jgi:type IV pilus assembly protein PilA